MDNPSINPADAEEFINRPDTMALVIDTESVNINELENNPNVLLSKSLVGDYVILYMSQENVDKIVPNAESHTSGIYPLVLGLLGEDELSTSGIIQVQDQPYLDLKGRGVLLGFVDTGIDYTKDAFKYEDGSSKVQYIWDQSIPGNAPSGYFFGSEYNNASINQALRSEDPFKTVPHRDTVGHGTFLASVAGSRERGEYIGAAPDSELIVVKLKRARPYDYSRSLIPESQPNAFSSDDLMLGIQYIVDKAEELGRPVAICVGVGTNQGGHDGFSILEKYLTRAGSVIGVGICLAAGNEVQKGHHTQGRIPETGASVSIELQTSDQLEDIYISLWNYASDRISVGFMSPTGEQVARLPARSGINYENKLILEQSTVIVEYLFPTEGSGGQFTRIKILAATPGVWTIIIYGDFILDGGFHAWLPLTGFISPEVRFLEPTPDYTIVTPATALGAITCGAYNSKNNSLYGYSSWGPTRLPAPMPDLSAPGVDVSGIFPTGYGTMSGTCISAAITAGACALLLQWGIVEGNDAALDSFRLRANLIKGCIRDSNITYPNNQWGYGRLNLFNTFQSLRPS